VFFIFYFTLGSFILNGILYHKNTEHF